MGTRLPVHVGKPRFVMGPDGEILTLANLPETRTTRWVPRKKAEVVTAVRGGLLSLNEACDRYALSIEEFSSWQDAMDRFGLDGLLGKRAKKCWRRGNNAASSKPGMVETPTGKYAISPDKPR